MHLLLALFVALGLLLAPLPISAAQGPAASDMAMAADMPGCPKKMSLDQCHKCPLMTVCFVKGAMAAFDELGTPFVHSHRLKLRPDNDKPRAGRDGSPPARPPRTLNISA